MLRCFDIDFSSFGVDRWFAQHDTLRGSKGKHACSPENNSSSVKSEQTYNEDLFPSNHSFLPDKRIATIPDYVIRLFFGVVNAVCLILIVQRKGIVRQRAIFDYKWIRIIIFDRFDISYKIISAARYDKTNHKNYIKKTSHYQYIYQITTRLI